MLMRRTIEIAVLKRGDDDGQGPLVRNVKRALGLVFATEW
jgi:hypothetical protein